MNFQWSGGRFGRRDVINSAEVHVPVRLRQRVRHGGPPGRAAREGELSPEGELRVVRGAVQRLRVYGAEGSQKRSWLYRIPPSVMHEPFAPKDQGLVRHAPFDEAVTPPNQFRWDPLPIPEEPTDFVDGLTTIAGNQAIGIHIYAANQGGRYAHIQWHSGRNRACP